MCHLLRQMIYPLPCPTPVSDNARAKCPSLSGAVGRSILMTLCLHWRPVLSVCYRKLPVPSVVAPSPPGLALVMLPGTSRSRRSQLRSVKLRRHPSTSVGGWSGAGLPRMGPPRRRPPSLCKNPIRLSTLYCTLPCYALLKSIRTRQRRKVK